MSEGKTRWYLQNTGEVCNLESRVDLRVPPSDERQVADQVGGAYCDFASYPLWIKSEDAANQLAS